AGRTRPVSEVFNLVDAWTGGAGRVGGFAGSEHAEHRTQFGQGLPADLVDRGERLPGPFWLPVHQVQSRVGLDVNDRDVVGDDVVQVAGDRQAFGHGLAFKLFFSGLGLLDGALVPGPD